MKTVSLLPLALLGLVACAAPAVDRPVDRPVDAVAPAPAESADSEQDEAEAYAEREKKAIELERRLELSQAKLEVARLEAEAGAARRETAIRHAQAEVEMAEASLARFLEVEMPNKLASARLDLRSMQDRATEAAEELEQIKIMYADQDLDDMTAEFVVSRGQRSAERAAARLEIQAGALASLEQRELPQEARRHELALDKAIAGMEAARRDAEIGQRKQEISLREAELEIVKLEEELAELREEQP